MTNTFIVFLTMFQIASTTMVDEQTFMGWCMSVCTQGFDCFQLCKDAYTDPKYKFVVGSQTNMVNDLFSTVRGSVSKEMLPVSVLAKVLPCSGKTYYTPASKVLCEELSSVGGIDDYIAKHSAGCMVVSPDVFDAYHGEVGIDFCLTTDIEPLFCCSYPCKFGSHVGKPLSTRLVVFVCYDMVHSLLSTNKLEIVPGGAILNPEVKGIYYPGSVWSSEVVMACPPEGVVFFGSRGWNVNYGNGWSMGDFVATTEHVAKAPGVNSFCHKGRLYPVKRVENMGGDMYFVYPKEDTSAFIGTRVFSKFEQDCTLDYHVYSGGKFERKLSFVQILKVDVYNTHFRGIALLSRTDDDVPNGASGAPCYNTHGEVVAYWVGCVGNLKYLTPPFVAGDGAPYGPYLVDKSGSGAGPCPNWRKLGLQGEPNCTEIFAIGGRYFHCSNVSSCYV